MLKGILVLLTVSMIVFQAKAVPSEGQEIMISAPSPYAVEVGKKIHKLGGNIADVTVAIGLSLAVTSPYYAALGGGGFALLKLGKKVEVLDFREVAPMDTHKEYYLEKGKGASQTGGAAVGVPGWPKGLEELHKKYGKLHWSQIVDPAIELAEKGFYVSGSWYRHTLKAKDRFNKGGKQVFFKKGEKPYLPGELFKQKELTKALKEIRNRGSEAFYSGRIAQDLIKTVKNSGGHLSIKDLAQYKVKWREPLKTQFMDHTLYLMPPPSSGGVVLKSALYMIEKLKLQQYPSFSVDELHLLAEVMSRSFSLRSELGDPEFHKNNLETVLSSKNLDQLIKTIQKDKVVSLKPASSSKKESKEESKETTHFSVMNSKGQAISLTVTLNGNYGSAVVSEQFGIALNNEMDDFTTQPGQPNMFGLIQGEGNLVEAGKRPLSSMSPTLVEKKGKIIMSIGAPGGPTIINGVLQALYRVLVSGMNIDEAIQAPRIHNQYLPEQLLVDSNRFFPMTLNELEKRGHKIKQGWVARVSGVRINDDGFLEGSHDLRGEGASGGY